MTAATPQQYMATFELTNDGQAVLDDLVQTFGGRCGIPVQTSAPDEVKAWVTANVTTLAQAQDAITTLAIAVSVLGRRL